jgi:hypothetical protein
MPRCLSTMTVYTTPEGTYRVTRQCNYENCHLGMHSFEEEPQRPPPPKPLPRCTYVSELTQRQCSLELNHDGLCLFSGVEELQKRGHFRNMPEQATRPDAVRMLADIERVMNGTAEELPGESPEVQTQMKVAAFNSIRRILRREP